MATRKRELKAPEIRELTGLMASLKVEYDVLAQWAAKMHTEDSQPVQLSTDFPPHLPGEGALATQRALEKEYGWTFQKARQGMFGPMPPQKMMLQTGPHERETVLWGPCEVPAFKGTLNLDWSVTKEGPVFQLGATTTKRYEKDFTNLCGLVSQELKSNSLYKGRAIEWEWQDPEEASSVEDFNPKFLDVSRVDQGQLILNADTAADVEDLIYTWITHRSAANAANLPAKRGINLVGQYGCGKTLASRVAAMLCEKHGVTFILIRHADQIVKGVRWALSRKEPIVIFCEDIDRVAKGVERTTEVDAILNTLDGVESKGAEMLCIFTSNHPEKIHGAMQRPGRIDKTIYVGPPDKDACNALLEMYSKGSVAPGTSFGEAARILDGQIPARVEESVSRAKWSALRRTGTHDFQLTEEDLVRAAKSVVTEQAGMQVADKDDPTEIERAASLMADPIHDVVRALTNGHSVPVKR